MEKNRLEAFSDGVIAIIITIMILELGIPAGDKFSDLANLWHIILSYAVSFFFIAIYWVNHHHIFNIAKTIHRGILWSNIIWLFVMSFIPFATAWVGKYPNAWAPIVLYFGDMLLACVAFHVLYYFILKENVGPHSFKPSLRSILSFFTYLLATCLGGYCPFAAYICVAAVSISWIFPEKKRKHDDVEIKAE